MNWQQRVVSSSVGYFILLASLFVCVGCSSLRQVFTKEIASKSMSLDVRDSFFVPYNLFNFNAFSNLTSNSKYQDYLTTAPNTTISNAPVVPIVRHLSVNQVATELRTDTTYKAYDANIPGSSVVSKYSFKVIGLLLVLVVAILLIFVRRKR